MKDTVSNRPTQSNININTNLDLINTAVDNDKNLGSNSVVPDLSEEPSHSNKGRKRTREDVDIMLLSELKKTKPDEEHSEKAVIIFFVSVWWKYSRNCLPRKIEWLD